MSWLADVWLDVLGWGGSALLVFSIMQARVLRFRALNLIACLVLMIFNGALEIWPMVAMNAALAAINGWFLVRLVRERDDDSVYAVVELGRHDAFLRHLLSVHREDIQRFQPDFGVDHSLATPAAMAFVILNGDEAVGVVVLEVDGPIARVQLDYVTPRYRDFSPGSFVWRSSDVLRGHGFTKVITSPLMVNAYYDRIGFVLEGDSYVLDLGHGPNGLPGHRSE